MNSTSEPIVNSTSQLNATYYGYIESTFDALILFEACMAGHIQHVSRRPHDGERASVIQSGRVFIYEEKSSGIKRWTDGISWSPSRILGNFLLYRQLVKAFGPGEKKKAIKKSKVDPTGINKNRQDNKYNSRNKENAYQGVGKLQLSGGTYGQAGRINAETERSLIGSLIDSYDFLQDGLVKKTISVTCDDVTHHLVSYYTVADVKNRVFLVPSKDPRFAQCYPRASLRTSQNFRNPIEDIDSMVQLTYPQHEYEVGGQNLLQRHIRVMDAPENYSSHSEKTQSMCSSNYAMAYTSTTYEQTINAYNLTLGYMDHYAPIPSLAPTPHTYSAPARPGQYQEDHKLKFALASSSSTDDSPAPISTVTNVQRDTIVRHQRDSVDSGVSLAMNKTVKNSNSEAQNGVREVILTTTSAEAQTAFQSSSQTDFAHYIPFGWPPSNERKDRTGRLANKGFWQTGNASAGHGHYH